MKNCFRVMLFALVAFALVVGTGSEVFAQTTTGKISGRITDKGSGEPLPGVNIVLVGTNQGATADANGDYFILMVRPGAYEVQASLVGYHTVSKTDVVVSVDRTSAVDFALTESAMALSEITVVAERAAIELEVSYAQTIMKAAEVREAPVGPRLRDAFATQAGVDTDDWGLTIRGGSEEEIMYTMDGVGLKDNRNNRPYSSFSKTNLAEVQILTGGFSAEYGDARSGIVNIVTKEPRQLIISADGRYNPAGRKHFGPEVYSSDNWWDIGRFESDGPSADRDGDGSPDFKGWTQEFQDRGGPAGNFKAGIFDQSITTVAQAKSIWAFQHRAYELEDSKYNTNAADRESDYFYDATVGAPLWKDKWALMITNQRERTAYLYDLSKTSYLDNMVQVKSIMTPTATTKLTLSYIHGYAEGTKNGNFLGTFARSQVEASRRFDDVQQFAPGSQNNNEEIARNYYTLNWSQTLSPKTFYNVTARYGKTDWEATWAGTQKVGIPVAAVFPDGSLQEVTEANYQAAQAAGAVILDEAPVGWNYTNQKNDILGIYRLRGGGGASRSADYSWIKETDVTFDLTSQVTPHHQIKTGIQLHAFHLREFRGYVSSLPNRPEGLDDPDPAKLLVTQTADLHNYHARDPKYGGLFVQDRMEYRQIVVNAGVRLDFHQPATWWDLESDIHDEYLGSNTTRLYEKREAVKAPTRWAWSPRFGVSHPTTATSKMFFNYGHFYQVPTTVELYRAQSGAGEPLENFGNPWVEMPQTIAYELGFEKSFGGKYLTSGTVYFKDVDKELESSTRYYAEFNNGSTQWTTQGRIKDVRGFELSFKKSRGKHFTGYMSYDFRQERARRIGWNHVRDVVNGSNASTLVIEDDANGANPAFKARPIWKLGLNFRTPLDYGGDASLWKGGWDANVFFRREAGAWRNYNPSNDTALQNVLNVQWKDTNMADLRLSKAFDVKGSPMLYLEVHNIFNFKNFNHLNDGNGGEAFDHPGTSDSTRFRLYMESLGWVVDSSGKLQNGDRPGSGIDENEQTVLRRPYLSYLDRRDMTMGLQFSF